MNKLDFGTCVLKKNIKQSRENVFLKFIKQLSSNFFSIRASIPESRNHSIRKKPRVKWQNAYKRWVGRAQAVSFSWFNDPCPHLAHLVVFFVEYCIFPISFSNSSEHTHVLYLLHLTLLGYGGRLRLSNCLIMCLLVCRNWRTLRRRRVRSTK